MLGFFTSIQPTAQKGTHIQARTYLSGLMADGVARNARERNTTGLRLRLGLLGLLVSASCVPSAAQITLPNAVPLPNPEVQFLDSNGAPLAGSKLCSYQAGTSTPQATYTDSSAGTPNTNPIILDSAGRASIWVNASLYKFVLRTGGDGTCTTGSVVWTQDNVTDTTLYFTNFVKTVGTSTMITYTSPATGGVSRTQFSKNTDVTSVKDFGAVGDGSTDDTAAVTQAIADSSLTTCIYFPDGVYIVKAAFTSTHPVCLTGNAWRLKYTASGTIAAILTLNGGTASPTHGTFMEGSFIQGAILDGQGNATDGLILQAVVSAQINYVRATNVTDAGFSCNWCQQVTFEHIMVSGDFENFTTTPARGVVVDGISTANIFNQVNIDHVSGNGVDLLYAFETIFNGGASEGNGGIGVNCAGSLSPFRECVGNTFINMDLEVNTGGDFLFGTQANFNNVLQCDSFSNPGVTFTSNTHHNNLIGGLIGTGSTGGASTFGNSLINVSTIDTTGAVVWVDNGFNTAWPIYNQFNNAVIDPIDNNHVTSTLKNGATTTRKVEFSTASPGLVTEIFTGDPASNWIALQTVNGISTSWLAYPLSTGMTFMSQTAPLGTSVGDGSIINHQWCWGTFCVPAYKFHFWDGSITTLVPQNGEGQGTNDLMQFRDKHSLSDTLMSHVTYQGAFVGPVTMRASGGAVNTFSGLPACASGTEGHAEPISDSSTSTWGASISGGGSTHVLAYCNGTAYTVAAK